MKQRIVLKKDQVCAGWIKTRLDFGGFLRLSGDPVSRATFSFSVFLSLLRAIFWVVIEALKHDRKEILI